MSVVMVASAVFTAVVVACAIFAVTDFGSDEEVPDSSPTSSAPATSSEEHTPRLRGPSTRTPRVEKRLTSTVWQVDEPIIDSRPASAATVLSPALRAWLGLPDDSGDADTELALQDADPPTRVRGFMSQYQQPVDVSSVTAFVESGGRLPIVILAGDRYGMLNRTLTSLLAVRGVQREAIMVEQHGNNASVTEVLHRFGVRYHQNVGAVDFSYKARSTADKGAERIAQQYKYALTHMFDVVTDVRTELIFGVCVCVCVPCRGTPAGVVAHSVASDRLRQRAVTACVVC